MEERWQKMNWIDRITWILRGLNLSVMAIWIYRWYQGDFRTYLDIFYFLLILSGLISPWIIVIIHILKEYKVERRKKKK